MSQTIIKGTYKDTAMETANVDKKERRVRLREGGYKWMKENLYARIQYQDDTEKLKEKLRRVPSGMITDVWKEADPLLNGIASYVYTSDSRRT